MEVHEEEFNGNDEELAERVSVLCRESIEDKTESAELSEEEIDTLLDQINENIPVIFRECMTEEMRREYFNLAKEHKRKAMEYLRQTYIETMKKSLIRLDTPVLLEAFVYMKRDEVTSPSRLSAFMEARKQGFQNWMDRIDEEYDDGPPTTDTMEREILNMFVRHSESAFCTPLENSQAATIITQK